MERAECGVVLSKSDEVKQVLTEYQKLSAVEEIWQHRYGHHAQMGVDSVAVISAPAIRGGCVSLLE